MTWTASDYIVWVDSSGNVQYIQRSDGASIPPDVGNTDYQAFLVVDGVNKACARKTIPTPMAEPSMEQRLAAVEDVINAQLTG